jgi:hypothetical protein
VLADTVAAVPPVLAVRLPLRLHNRTLYKISRFPELLFRISDTVP